MHVDLVQSSNKFDVSLEVFLEGDTGALSDSSGKRRLHLRAHGQASQTIFRRSEQVIYQLHKASRIFRLKVINRL